MSQYLLLNTAPGIPIRDHINDRDARSLEQSNGSHGQPYQEVGFLSSSNNAMFVMDRRTNASILMMRMASVDRLWLERRLLLRILPVDSWFYTRSRVSIHNNTVFQASLCTISVLKIYISNRGGVIQD